MELGPFCRDILTFIISHDMFFKNFKCQDLLLSDMTK